MAAKKAAEEALAKALELERKLALLPVAKKEPTALLSSEELAQLASKPRLKAQAELATFVCADSGLTCAHSGHGGTRHETSLSPVRAVRQREGRQAQARQTQAGRHSTQHHNRNSLWPCSQRLPQKPQLWHGNGAGQIEVS